MEYFIAFKSQSKYYPIWLQISMIILILLEKLEMKFLCLSDKQILICIAQNKKKEKKKELLLWILILVLIIFFYKVLKIKKIIKSKKKIKLIFIFGRIFYNVLEKLLTYERLNKTWMKLHVMYIRRITGISKLPMVTFATTTVWLDPLPSILTVWYERLRVQFWPQPK